MVETIQSIVLFDRTAISVCFSEILMQITIVSMHSLNVTDDIRDIVPPSTECHPP